MSAYEDRGAASSSGAVEAAPGMTALEAVRSRYLRQLETRDRILRVVIAAPLALFAPMAASVAYYGSHVSIWGSAGISIGLTLFIVFYILGRLQTEWSAQSYAPKHNPDTSLAIDWSDLRWHPVARALVASGYDPAVIQAVSVFNPDVNIQVTHRPRFSEGRFRKGQVELGRARVSGQTKRRVSLITSIVVITGTVAPGFADRVGFWCGVVAAVSLPVWLPAWVLMAAGQIKVNMLHPDNVVEIPWQWRTALAKDPQAAQVAFAHEMAHARHGDTVVRRLLGHVVIWMIGLGWADALGAASALASARLTTACLWLFSYLMLASPGAMVSIRRARRLLDTIQELRADAEACSDEQSMWHMRGIVAQAQRIAPSRTQTARLHALSHGWADPIAGQVLNTVIIMAYGCVVPVMFAVALLWTGAIPALPPAG